MQMVILREFCAAGNAFAIGAWQCHYEFFQDGVQ
jgi:hypothetical protein